MASTLCCRARASPIFSTSSTIRRRLPLIGAFCMLSFGFCNFSPSFSSSFSVNTGCAQSLPFAPLLKSKFSTQAPAKTSSSIRMESGSDTVPSIVVYVTVPNKEEGKKLAESIVREKLAACVNIVPEQIQSDAEELLIIKSRQSLLEALTKHVEENHPYEVPEVIALPINGGSTPYLKWLKNNTRD
ncbi:protein CutA, chloroplastic isoform X2 [Cannabis sativa]|uniref:protein CutA, chloroplastic isoform X2 n=1 Tax=Cannabis sativa TaxID=3483 RepID=UPI0029CA118B|nr:protein CutA, chloroplastic isoform X2 [Cannabis sativa]